MKKVRVTPFYLHPKFELTISQFGVISDMGLIEMVFFNLGVANFSLWISERLPKCEVMFNLDQSNLMYDF